MAGENIRANNKKVLFFNSVGNKVVMGVVVATIVLIASSLLVMNVIISNQLEEYFSEQMAQKEEILKYRLDAQKTELLNSAKVMAETLGGKTWNTYMENRTLMQDFVNAAYQTYSFIDMLKIHGPQGQYIYAKRTDKLDYPVTQLIINECAQGNERYNILKHNSDTLKVAGYPIFGEDKKTVVGIVFAAGYLSDQKTIEQIANNTGCAATIFDGYTRRRTTLKGMENSKLNHTSLVDDAMKGKSTIVNTEINGTPYYALYFPLLNAENRPVTTLFLGIDATVKSHLISKLIQLLVMIVGIIGVVIILVLYVLILRGQLIKPLKDLDKITASLSSEQADLTLRLPVRERNINEFDVICEYINAFIIKLHRIVESLSKSQVGLVQLVEKLSSTSYESASSAEEILGNIESIKTQSQNQANSVAKTSGILAESSTSCNALTQLIDEEAAAIIESSAAIEEMLGNIRTVSSNINKMSDSFHILNTTVQDGQQKLENVNTTILQIETQSAMLNDANAMISQIASQTNLLAMNAAIEAAHAGEAGKGFSVVADEIRKLAENSSAQSKQISSELQQITTSIKNVVEGATASQQSFGQIVEHITFTNNMMEEIHHAMQEQEEASKQIFEALSEMRTQSTEVDDKAKYLDTGVNNVSQEMDNVNQIADTILGSMGEMVTGAKQVNVAAQEVASMASQTKETTENIAKLLSQFSL